LHLLLAHSADGWSDSRSQTACPGGKRLWGAPASGGEGVVQECDDLRPRVRSRGGVASAGAAKAVVAASHGGTNLGDNGDAWYAGADVAGVGVSQVTDIGTETVPGSSAFSRRDRWPSSPKLSRTRVAVRGECSWGAAPSVPRNRWSRREPPDPIGPGGGVHWSLGKRPLPDPQLQVRLSPISREIKRCPPSSLHVLLTLC